MSAAESETRRLKARLGEAEAALEAGRRAVRERAARRRTYGCGCCWTPSWRRPRACAANWRCRPCPRGPPTPSTRSSPAALAQGRRGPRAVRDRSGAARPAPRAAAGHLVVDGYNVTKTGYPTMPLEKQRLRLLERALGAGRPLGRRVAASSTARSWPPRCCSPRPEGAGALLQARGDRRRTHPAARTGRAAGSPRRRGLQRPGGGRRGRQVGCQAGAVGDAAEAAFAADVMFSPGKQLLRRMSALGKRAGDGASTAHDAGWDTRNECGSAARFFL